MDKPRRLLYPLELQDQYNMDYKTGYSAYLNGGPSEPNNSPGWRDGWNDAKSELAESKGHISEGNGAQ